MIYAIYDLEIINCISSAPKPNGVHKLRDGLVYCGGWNDYENMGISVGALCFLDTEADYITPPIACTSTAHLKVLLEGIKYPIGGFNSKKFDDNLLKANGINITSDFDILQMVLRAADMEGVQYWRLDSPRKYNLDSITQANGCTKTGRGDLAPVLWQQGKYEQVIEYCKNDVLIEAEMLRLLLSGELVDPNTGEHLEWNY